VTRKKNDLKRNYQNGPRRRKARETNHQNGMGRKKEDRIQANELRRKKDHGKGLGN
jgi:hypothetical protein